MPANSRWDLIRGLKGYWNCSIRCWVKLLLTLTDINWHYQPTPAKNYFLKQLICNVRSIFWYATTIKCCSDIDGSVTAATNCLVIPVKYVHTWIICYRKFKCYVSRRLRFRWNQNNAHSVYSVGSFAAESMIVLTGEENHKDYVLALRKFSLIYRSVNFARADDFKINYFIYYIITCWGLSLYNIMFMAIAIFKHILALCTALVSFLKCNVSLNLLCFNTHSSTVIQTVYSIHIAVQ